MVKGQRSGTAKMQVKDRKVAIILSGNHIFITIKFVINTNENPNYIMARASSVYYNLLYLINMPGQNYKLKPSKKDKFL